MTIKLPNVDVVQSIHDIVIDNFGGKNGILKLKSLQAVLARPMHHITYSDCDLHYICAVLLQAVATSHVFVDGNKRTAVFICVYTYAINGVVLNGSKKLNMSLESLVLEVVTDKLSITDVSARLSHIVDKHTIGILGKAREKIDDFFTL